MRINIVTGFFLPVPAVRGGSTEKAWHGLAAELSAKGHSVAIVSRSWTGFPDTETTAGIRHLRLPGSDHTTSLLRNLWLDLRWGVQVRRRLPIADVTICNTVSLPVLLGLKRHAGGKVAVVMARMPKGHGKLYGRADRIYALSSEVSSRLTTENLRLTDHIRLLPYPINWTLLSDAASAAKRTPASPVHIIFIGRIHPEKGMEVLLEACRHLSRTNGLPDWRITLIGPQSIPQGGGGESYVAALRGRFARDLASKLDIREPEFDAVRLASCYAEADVFCYPSLAEGGETFGVAVAEAMAASAVPVVSALACFRDLVRSGETGFVFDHRAADPALNLAQVLERLIKDPELRSVLGRCAKAHAKRFDFKTLGAMLEADLRELTGAA